MSWKNKFTFRDKSSVKHEVGGKEFRFYPNKVALLNEACSLSEPIAQAVNILFADQSRDASSNVKRTHDGDFFMEDIQTQGIDIDMAKHRVQERNAAIKTIIGTLSDKRSMILFGRLFMDSLREEFPYDPDRAPGEVEEFIYGAQGKREDGDDYNGLDVPAFWEIFRGWMKANAKVFGESGESMVELVKGKLEKIAVSNSEKLDSTNGNSFNNPSSPQSVTDSQQSISTD